MFIAHLPAGYILGRLAQRRHPSTRVLAAALLGSVLPDVDIFYFYMLDGASQHHHRYWTHIPAWWAVISMALLLLLRAPRLRMHDAVARAFLAGVWSHLLLDSVAGDIMWAHPVSAQLFSLVHVPNRHAHWMLNFLLHWTALVEVGICVAALLTHQWWRWRHAAGAGSERRKSRISRLISPGRSCWDQ